MNAGFGADEPRVRAKGSSSRLAGGAVPSLVWCTGIEGSGSTWLFNAVLGVAARLWSATPPFGRFVVRYGDLVHPSPVERPLIVKSHATEAAAAAELAARAGTIFVSVRDPRDCVGSLMLYQFHSFAAALDVVERSAQFCARVARYDRAMLLRYETGFPDVPETLDRIAAALGGVLSPDQRATLFTDMRREAIEAAIAGLNALKGVHRHPNGDLVDPETQWHRHHAGRSGHVGRWRHVLDVGQAACVEARLYEWMCRFGYVAEWASPGTLLDRRNGDRTPPTLSNG